MKVALYKNIEWADSEPNVCSHHMEGAKNYVRVSEFVEVDFPPLAVKVGVDAQVAALEAAAANIRARILELRAIGHEVP